MIFRYFFSTTFLVLSGISASYAEENLSNAEVIEMNVMTVQGAMFAQPDQVSGSAHRVDSEILETFQYDDINRVLNFVPGVYAREEDGYGLRPNIGLRGGNPDRSQKVTLMEDGVLVAPAPYSAPAAYFFPLTSRMVGVEVFKGPSSIQHGPQTIGGAVNMISAPIPDERSLLAEVGLGSYGYRSTHVRGGTQLETVGVMGEFVHMGSDGFKKLDGGGDTGFEKNELLFKVGREIGVGKLELRLGYADEVSDETYLGLTEADFRADHLRRYRASALDEMEWQWSGGRINWSQPALEGELHVTAYKQSLDRAWLKFNNFKGADIHGLLENPQGPFNQVFIKVLQGGDTDGVGGSLDDLRIGTNDRSYESGGLQAVMQWNFGDTIDHGVEVGVRHHTDQINRLHDEYGFEQINGELIRNDQPRAITARNKAKTDALAIWLRDEMVYQSWMVVPGVRIESISNHFTDHLTSQSNDNDYTVVLPGLGAHYEVNEQISLLAGVHRGFSPASPSLKDDAKPEESINYEVGGRLNSDYGRLEVIGFFNDYSNLTSICTLSSGCAATDLDTQTNVGEVHIFGVETGWSNNYDITPTLILPIALNYTYTDSVFQNAFTSTDPAFGNVLSGYKMPYLPQHKANLRVGVENVIWSVQLSATYVSQMRNVAGKGSIASGEGSDSYTVLDLAGYYKLAKNWEMSARIDNLMDEVYVVSRRPYGARPGKPLGVQWELRYQY